MTQAARTNTDLTLNGHIKTAQRQTIIQQYGDVIGTLGTLAVDGWAVTFSTAKKCLDGPGCGPVQASLRCTKCNSAPTNGQLVNQLHIIRCGTIVASAL